MTRLVSLGGAMAAVSTSLDGTPKPPAAQPRPPQPSAAPAAPRTEPAPSP